MGERALGFLGLPARGASGFVFCSGGGGGGEYELKSAGRNCLIEGSGTWPTLTQELAHLVHVILSASRPVGLVAVSQGFTPLSLSLFLLGQVAAATI